MNQSTPILEVEHVTKRFPGVLALQNVSMNLHEGEVLALIGENGAGKSTLMKILAGVQEPDTGTITINGKNVRVDSVRKALEHGVALIHQELNLSGNLTVGANIFLGREPGQFSVINRKAIHDQSKKYLKMVGLDISPNTLVDHLPIGQQQMVEIAKALSVDARVLIMDEPTSSLSSKETDNLFKVVKSLRERGVSVIYISHRLGEVKELADRVTVLRDGENAGDLPREEITHDNMVKLMVGRDISQFYARHPHNPGDVVMSVNNLVTPAHPGHKLNFEIRAGEIVGISGLVGAGRTEMLRVLFGVDHSLGGELKVAGNTVNFKSPLDAINAGIALVPENRKEEGLIVDMPVRENMGLAGLKRYSKTCGLLNFSHEYKLTHDMIDKLNIKTPNDMQIVRFLSGGNQQKVVLGKWLGMEPKLLLLDEPTRGIDVGAKEEIYHLMDKLAGEGLAVLFVSSELEEIIGMSDRALVMHEGCITGELKREELTEESIMQLATGNPVAA